MCPRGVGTRSATTVRGGSISKSTQHVQKAACCKHNACLVQSTAQKSSRTAQVISKPVEEALATGCALGAWELEVPHLSGVGQSAEAHKMRKKLPAASATQALFKVLRRKQQDCTSNLNTCGRSPGRKMFHARPRSHCFRAHDSSSSQSSPSALCKGGWAGIAGSACMGSRPAAESQKPKLRRTAKLWPLACFIVAKCVLRHSTEQCMAGSGQVS